eukprot:448805_1
MNSIMLQSTLSDPFGGGTGPSMFGYLGVSSAIIFSCLGAAYGTARAGAGLSSVGVRHPNIIMRNMIAVVMAGVLGIYGLIIAVILLQNIGGVTTGSYTAFNAYAQLGSGLSVGLSCLGIIIRIFAYLIQNIYNTQRRDIRLESLVITA